MVKPGRSRCISLVLVLTLSLGLVGCSLPRVNAEDRLFLNLSVDWVGTYELPKLKVDNAPIGGLSGIAYDRPRDRLYVVSDDRSNFAPARFYTLKLTVQSQQDGAIALAGVEVEAVTPLTDRDGNPYPAGTVDFEGIALSPLQSVFIASEGAAVDGIPPFIGEFDLATGRLRRELPMPDRYLPKTLDDGQRVGVQNNLAFESLTLNPGGTSPSFLEPYRLFVATESALHQDIPDTVEPDQGDRSRFMHYLIAEDKSTLLAEHLYLIEPPPPNAIGNGLTELLVLDSAGHFLALERSFGPTGFSAKLFQLASGSATDISGVTTLKGDITGIEAIRKRLVLDLADLNLPLSNLEGMTLGPRLPDGSSSLIIVSDDNFDADLPTQFLLFRIRGLPRS